MEGFGVSLSIHVVDKIRDIMSKLLLVCTESCVGDRAFKQGV